MNVDENAYPYVYDITRNNVTIKFSNTIKKLCIDGNLQMEEIFNGTNSYIGFDPRLKNNWVGGSQYGTFKFGTGSEGFGKIGFENSRYERRINYRPVIVSSGFADRIHHSYLRWTNLNEPWVEEFVEGQQTITINNSFTNDSAYIQYLNNSYVLRAYPITDIDLDKIVLDPRFFISRVTLTKNSNGVYTGISQTTTLMRYSQLKPQDKTAQGASYDDDLWEKGFKLVSSSSSQDVYDICIGCYVVAYIGNGGSRVSLNSISFSEWTTDAGKPSESYSNFGIMQETLVDGSVTYSFIPGIYWTPADVQVSDPAFRVIYNVLSNRYSASGLSSTVGTVMGNNMDSGLSAYTNENYSEIITDYNFFTDGLYDFLTYPTIQNTYYVLENGQIMRVFYYSGARYLYIERPCYPIKDLVSTIASMGFFFVSDGSFNSNIETPGTNVYRGNYTSEGISDGTWKQGDDIDTDPLNDISYIPDIPDKPEPSDDDDSSGDNITPYNFVNTPLGAANNFITLYSLNTAQVADFGRRMWASLSDTAFWESVGTVFLNDFSINPADMMKYFVSLRYFPFDLSIVHSSQTWGIYIGRSSYPIQPSIGTELPHRITMNLVQLDGGSVEVPNHYDDFRDYEPYTKVSVTVPFCGVLELTPSEVVGKTLYLDYVIDLQTGTIKATVSVQSNTFFIVGSLSGVCGSQIPLTANNNIEFLQRIANVGSSIISSGSSAGNAADTVAGLTGSGAIGAVAGGVVMGANAVGSMLSLPPITVHKQGNATGFANYGGSSRAYLTVQRQKYIVPNNYGHSVGYATAFASVLSALSGFTVCSNVDLSGFTCHEDERSEIKALLESGVYL